MPFLNDYPQLKIVRDIALRQGVSVHLVGGFLRDFLLSSPKDDFDFAVDKNALRVARAFSRKVKGAFVMLDEERGCARVVKKANGSLKTFDFADYRAKTFQGDLAHRDFTINTLSVDVNALNPLTEIEDVIADHKKGLKDIKDKRIRRISARAFREDPLRMMRAFSLRATLGFKIEQKTLDQIKRDKDLICQVSYERIRDELFKILETKKAAEILKAMDRAGLLEKIIPQIRVMYRCKQGTYHHLDVWPHSLETAAMLEGVFRQVSGTKDISDYLDEDLGGNRSRRSLIRLAALLHDVGKPDTRKREKGKISFHGHEHVGKHIVKHVSKMLKLSVHERHALEDMVRWHLRPGYLSNFKKPSEKAVYRYFRDAKEEGASIALLSLADQRATRGPATTAYDQKHHEKICLALVKRFFEKKNEMPFTRLINGHDLIHKLKLKPSPVFAKILAEVEEQQTLGKIKTRQEALQLAKKLIKGS